ncbi:dienelactone hydrolase family protein [Cytobacillus depressus]|uniref:Dienelactone hydrolase family protein n=1 Tax=Cytobacillus depressus TaxID=1602942 RepID=A0A6L3V5D4_9BACI|nr:dienelactone hydrolase family protein [Cytobacillus depressus]KAB2336273.1 dienelactone hydrolase family protein [Cytobacillus depressus]
MLKINKKSDNLIIVVHEIYGINQHMVDLCELLSEQNFDLICPNLFEQEIPFDYSQEEKAYHNFMNNVGFTNGLHKVKNILLAIQDQYSKIFIIGFSVGATVAWLCSEEECVDGIVGYYGSRIRDYVNINPKCPVLLFFPKVEKSFNVDELVSTLDKPNIDVHICSGEHGFSDPYSTKYNEELAQTTFRETLHFFKNN